MYCDLLVCNWEPILFSHQYINLLAPDFFLILAHSAYKIWIIQEPNTLELWNKLHFEEKKKRRVYAMFKIFGTCICWIKRGVCMVLVRKPERRRPLGRPRRRWVDNIRMDLQEVVCGYMDWIGLAQDRDRWRSLVSAVMNLWVPWNAENFLTSCKPASCSGRTLYHAVSKYLLNKYIKCNFRG